MRRPRSLARRTISATAARKRSAQAEIDVGDVGSFGLSVEELTLGEPERSSDEHVGEGRYRRVVIEDGRVVVLARERDLVLGRRQLLLELEDVLVRLEVRVVLDHREQRAKRAGQRVLGCRLLRWPLAPGR